MCDDSDEIHVAKGKSECGDSGGWAPDEHDGRADKGGPKMSDTIWEPCQEIEESGLMGGQNVREVGAVEDVFEGWQDLYPDGRPPFGGDESRFGVSTAKRNGKSRASVWGSSPASIKPNQVRSYRHERSEELSRNGKDPGEEQQGCDCRLDQRSRGFDYAQGKDTYDRQEQPLKIINGPSVVL